MGRFRYKERSLRIRRSLDAAIASQQAGRLDETERLSRRILAVQPDHPEALFLLAAAVNSQGERQEAVELLTRAIEIAPFTAAFHGQLGKVLADQGRHEEAAESFGRALALDSKRSEFV
jgi:tetratricopeptide (TPR) repeat protein